LLIHFDVKYYYSKRFSIKTNTPQMRIKQLQVKNFRLLENLSVNVEDDITLIVGKNNTGKTSLFEVINIFTKSSQEISFEDFSLSTILKFRRIILKKFLKKEKSFSKK